MIETDKAEHLLNITPYVQVKFFLRFIREEDKLIAVIEDALRTEPDEPYQSVTNAAEQVVQSLLFYNGHYPHAIIYADSEGDWSGLNVNVSSGVVTFYPIAIGEVIRQESRAIALTLEKLAG